nr:hypothetical protein [Cellvibrio zantedeschiae]
MKKLVEDKHLPPVFRWSFLGPRYWLTWLMLGLLKLVAHLPLSINIHLGKALGWLFFHIARAANALQIPTCVYVCLS